MLNGVQTTGTISPASPSSGGQFSLTNYQTTANLPQQLAGAAAAIQSNLEGSATAQIDVVGATPATTSEGPFNFNVTIPSPVPASGVTLLLPASPETVGPFTATASAITIEEDSIADLTLTIEGTNLSLNCTAYANNDVATSGIDSGAGPTGNPIDPVIAVAGGGTPTCTAGSSCSVDLTGTGFDPGETVDFTLHSSPVDLGTATADSNGNVTFTATIPADTAAGSHQIIATGETSGITATFALTVSASPTSSTTTSSTAPSTAASGGSGSADTVSASSGSLAFTGTGPGIGWLGMAGAALLLAGFALLFLVDMPRRVLHSLRFSRASSRYTEDAERSPRMLTRGVVRLRSWMLGR